MLNDQKRASVLNPKRFAEQSHVVHVLLSHGPTHRDILLEEYDIMHGQVISLVITNMSAIGASTVSVNLLSIIAHEQKDTMHSFFYSIISYDVDGSAPNNIIGKSLVGTRTLCSCQISPAYSVATTSMILPPSRADVVPVRCLSAYRVAAIVQLDV